MGTRRDTGLYLYQFLDFGEVVFEVHADNIETAMSKLCDLLSLSEGDSRRFLPWVDWPFPQPAGDSFRYGKFRDLHVKPRQIPDPLLRPVQK